MAELTSAQIDALVRAVQGVVDFLAGQASAEVASLEQALQAMHDTLLAAGLPPQLIASLRQNLAARARVEGAELPEASGWVRSWLADDAAQALFEQDAANNVDPLALSADTFAPVVEPASAAMPDETLPAPAPFDSTYRPEITGLFGQDIGLDQQNVTFRPEQAALTGDMTGSGMLPPGVPPELAMLNLDGMGPGLLGGVSSGIGTGAASRALPASPAVASACSPVCGATPASAPASPPAPTASCRPLRTDARADLRGETSEPVSVLSVAGAPEVLESDDGDTLVLVRFEPMPAPTLRGETSEPVSVLSVAGAPEVLESDDGDTLVLVFTVSRSGGSGATQVQWNLDGLDPALFDGNLPGGLLSFAEGR